ncbi:hypothetical protein ACJJIX_02845 [Microbulbifer sp. VAAC004]|uniref:hypothetical protein n=1 Tax=unclassified Microbulbifer TaxID=2619833 RepID=UPI004039FD85
MVFQAAAVRVGAGLNLTEAIVGVTGTEAIRIGDFGQPPLRVVAVLSAGAIWCDYRMDAILGIVFVASEQKPD